jgi:hypothetical protein
MLNIFCKNSMDTMKAGLVAVILLLLVSGCVFVTAGCIAAKSPASATPVPPPTTGIGAALVSGTLPVPPQVSATVATATSVIGATMPATPVPSPAPPSGYSTNADVPDNPWMENLDFIRSYFPFTVPGCRMNESFPEIARGYGIRQPVPALIALSPDQMDAFLQESPGPAGSAVCAAAPGDPGWNFVKIEGTILPRNARPAEYVIGINVRSRGRIIAQFSFSEALRPGEPVSFERYVPLRSDEMDLFDSIELVFYKKR